MGVKEEVKLGVKEEVKLGVNRGTKVLLTLLLLFGQCSLYNVQCSLFNVQCSMALAQRVYSPEAVGKVADGIVYYLPKTAIEFNLRLEKKTFTPGELAPYAEKYALLRGVEQEEKITYSIANYGLTQIGIRDTSKCYHVKLKGGKCETAEFHMTGDGILQSMNADPIQPKLRKPFVPAKQKEGVNPYHYLNAEAQSAKNTEKKAELTTKQMLDLQEHRRQLYLGKAPDQPATIEERDKMIEEIERQYDILTTLFTGSVRRDTIEQQIIICPEKEVKKELIFRLSPEKGLVDKSEEGIPYFMTVEDMHRTTLQQYDIPENKKEGGFYLNVPGRIKLSFYRESHFLAAFDLYAAQFGFVELRSGSLFKRYVTHMQLNPTTGSVEKIHADM